MATRESMSTPFPSGEHRVSRRSALLRLSALAALPIVAACGQPQPQPPPPALAPEPAPAPGAPAASATTPAAPKAAISGRLAVVQSRDFHPNHNELVERTIRTWAEQMGYPLEHTYTEAYAGAGNVVQRLTAAVQAGDAPDVLTHTLRPSELRFLNLIESVDGLAREMTTQYGDMLPAIKRRVELDGHIWAIPHFSRAGGYFARETPFRAAGIDIRADLANFEAVREACLRASRPGEELWGWGMTANRSGDGETVVRNLVMLSGGQLTDETGQLVVLNEDPYRQHAVAGIEWLREVYTDPRWQPMLPPGVLAWTDPSNNEAYLAGKVFFTSNAGTMFATAVVNNNPVADDTFLIPTPAGIGPAARSLSGAGDSMNWYVMRGARNREAGEQLIRHLMSPELQREMYQISVGYVYPAYANLWDEPIFTQDRYARQVTPAWREIAFDPSGFTQGEWPGPPTPWTASLESSNFWTDMFGEALSGKPAATVVADAHRRAVSVFREFGAQGA
jgi:multiple sugar transport system substrate-binding protein